MQSENTCPKQSDYHNCNYQEESNGEYCLMHKPDKNEAESKRFYNKLLNWGERKEIKRKNAFNKEKVIFKSKTEEDASKSKIIWNGFVFPEVPPEFNTNRFSIFKYAIFEDPLVAHNTVFNGDINFEGAEFRRSENIETTFANANFEGETDFSGCKFFCCVDFEGAKFKGQANFSYAEFEQLVEFHHTVFQKRAKFKEAKFRGDLWMFDALFESKADFSLALFGGDSDLNRSAFFGISNFEDAVFLGDLELGNSDFQRGVNLVAMEKNGVVKYFYKYALQEMDYWDPFIGIDSADDINDLTEFNRECWEEIDKKLILKYEKGNNEEVNETLNGDEALRVFRDPLSYIHNLGLTYEDILAIEVYVDKFNTQQAKIDGYRKQRNSLAAKSKKEEADQAFLREMRAKREGKPGYKRFLEYVFIDLSCSYGTSWGKLMSLVGILPLAVFPVLYRLLPIWFPGGLQKSESIAPHWGKSFYHSVVTFTTLGYGDLEPRGPLFQGISALESSFGVLLTALIIVVFARKWMR